MVVEGILEVRVRIQGTMAVLERGRTLFHLRLVGPRL
jgi:hypothetical protein